MKNAKRALALILSVILAGACMLTPVSAEEIYEVPKDILRIESEAFAETDLPKRIFIPAETQEIAPDAFSEPESLTVYGFSGSAAEAYALSSGASFVSVDIQSVSLTAPAWASPYTEVLFRADALSGGALTYAFTVYEGETVLFESGETDKNEFACTFLNGGEYTASVLVKNRYTEAEATLASPVTVANPIQTEKETFFLSVGDTVNLISELETRAVSLTSPNPEALTVTGTSVTANELGFYTVTAKAETEEGDVFTQIDVFVIREPEAVQIFAPAAFLNAGASMQFSAYVLPEDTAYKTVFWSVSDETIAKIDENGLLTAKKRGEVKVYAACANVQSEYTLTVREPVSEIEIHLSHSPETISAGMRFALTASVKPDTAYNPSVRWHSSDESIVKIDAFTGEANALSKGEVVLTAEANDLGGASAEYALTVLEGVTELSLMVYR